jgi:hypothetical protein
MSNFYLKYTFEYNLIFDILKKHNIKKINFFIDLQSICTGFYNRDVVLMEVGRYVSDGHISDILLSEYRQYLINLYTRFKNFDPYFVSFFDDGKCQQNRALQTEYKSKNSIDNMQLEVENLQLFRTIKKYYFSKIYEQYNKKQEVSRAFYLKEFEADLIPHYCITKNLFDSQEINVGNFILSKDKDLLQTCQFQNTFQIVSGFKPSKGKNSKYSRVFGNEDSIEYIYPNFKRGILTSKHIALILAICGDKADMIPGITGIGPAKAVQLIQDFNLPTTIDELKLHKNLPDIIKKNFDLLISNLKITSFDEQIKRTPAEAFK